MHFVVYRDWLTMPKIIINGASDDLFMPDDYDYFFKDLQGEKYIWSGYILLLR